MVRSLPSQYHTGQSQSEAFWRTCIGDHHGINRPADPGYGEKFLDFKQNTIRKYAVGNPSSTPGPKPISENENLLAAEQAFLEAAYIAEKPHLEAFHSSFLFWNAFTTCCFGRCFGLTEKGYMVIGPPGANEGDVLCLIMGAQVPFLLRPISDSDGNKLNGEHRYALVGECYVHGLMDGEGLKQGLDEQSFVIC
jgi:hypothetical protein